MMWLLALAAGWLLTPAHAIPLPFDRGNPILYENDSETETYTDELLMALASAGKIRLVGLVTTGSWFEQGEGKPGTAIVDPRMFDDRQRIVEMARRSGLRNFPDSISGAGRSLVRPASGRIEDTVPADSPGTRAIIQAAHNASSSKPLVIVMGGQATAVASAYLIDPTIAPKVILSWFVGTHSDMDDYNGWVDGWAAGIVLQRLRVVMFPVHPYPTGLPHIPKSRLYELPATELRQHMILKDHGNGNPGEWDGDAPPVIGILRHDYAASARRVSVGGWRTATYFGNPNEFPVYRDDPNSDDLLITVNTGSLATDEWWAALKDPAAWAPAPAPTDLNADGATNISDVQLAVNQALQLAACAGGDVNGDGGCTVLDVQLVVNKALGL